jgi:molybdenum cofactor cytidylyltransferase
MKRAPLVGVLLAAGLGRRFDASGAESKLLQSMSDGRSVIQHSASALISALPNSFIVVNQHQHSAALLAQCLPLGFAAVSCTHDQHHAEFGLASSIMHAIQATPENCAGWIIALADMPYVQPSTIYAIRDALQTGAEMVVPSYGGRRGNPVGFSARCRADLLALRGDQGARQLLREYPLQILDVADAGILRDIDLREDLLS